ncbi:MAG: mechanosensitive ion channel family protein [Paracoccaceae bacterium]
MKIGRLMSAVVGWVGMLSVLALLHAVPAGAQAQLYDQLLGNREAASPQQSRPAAPLPAPQLGARSDPQSGPTAADYGRVAESLPDPVLDATRQAVSVFRSRLSDMFREMPRALQDIRTALAAASPTGAPSYFMGIAFFAGLLLVVGRAVTALYNVYFARRWMVAAQRGLPQGYVGKLPILAYRVALTFISVIITLSVATAVGLVFYQEHEATTLTVIIVFAAYGLVLMVDTLWRMTVAPYLSEYRLPVIEDEAARSLYRWLSLTSVFGIVSMAFCYWMQALGLAVEMHNAIIILLSLVTIILVAAMIRVHMPTITGILLAGKSREEASWPALLASTLWVPAVLLYLTFTWADMSFRLIMGIEQGPFRLAVPYVILMAGLLVYAFASYCIERIFARNREIDAINAAMEAERAAEEAAADTQLKSDIMAAAGDAADVDGDGDEESGGVSKREPDRNLGIFARRRPGMQTMEDLARRTASIFAVSAVMYALIRFWGGPRVFEEVTVLRIAEDLIDTIFVGYIIFHAVRIWIDARIRDEVGDEPEEGAIVEGEGGGAGATRIATLLPLVRNFVLIVIVVAVLLVLATELGVNVAPLFAGAGIVGLAIGFGSQTLVRDILSGAFFLMDDAFRKGEYIDVGDVKGTVEKISLRSFQLRHHLGMLHTIPFGDLQYLTNYSRDWVMMKLPLRLTYDTDVERVRKLIKKLGLSLLEDPEIGDKFIQPLKSQGVIHMDDSAMIVRMKFMTHPGEQWVLRKRIFAEIRELFEAEGIKFAHREVTVRIPGIEDKKDPLSEDEMKAVGAAARRSVDAVEEEPLATGTGGVADTR